MSLRSLLGWSTAALLCLAGPSLAQTQSGDGKQNVPGATELKPGGTEGARPGVSRSMSPPAAARSAPPPAPAPQMAPPAKADDKKEPPKQ